MGPLIRNIFRALLAIPAWRVRRPGVMPPRSKPMAESELVAYLQRKRLHLERPTGGNREG